MVAIPTYNEPWSGKPTVPRTITVGGDRLTLRYSRIQTKSKADELVKMIKGRPQTKKVRVKKHQMAAGSAKPGVQYAVYAVNYVGN